VAKCSRSIQNPVLYKAISCTSSQCSHNFYIYINGFHHPKRQLLPIVTEGYNYLALYKGKLWCQSTQFNHFHSSLIAYWLEHWSVNLFCSLPSPPWTTILETYFHRNCLEPRYQSYLVLLAFGWRTKKTSSRVFF
jgi:hypothetical protein